MISPEDRALLEKARPQLVQLIRSVNIKGSDLFEQLRRRHVIGKQRELLIQAEQDDGDKVGLLLKFVSTGGAGMMDAFIHSLTDSGYEHVVREYLRPPNNPDLLQILQKAESSYRSATMDPVHEDCLRINRIFLLENLQVKTVMDYMIQDRVLSIDVVENILSEQRARDQARALLNKMSKCGPMAFDSFVGALEKTSQEFIAQTLVATFDEMKSKTSGTPATRPDMAIENIPKGQLDIIRLIGRGVLSKVYLADDTTRHGKVAVKCLRNITPTFTKEEVKILLEEAQLMSRARHENILGIFGVCIEAERGFCAIILPYMSRGSLQQLLVDTSIQLSWVLRTHILYQIARGMNYLHQLEPQVLHTNLKPANVMLTEQLHARIADVGLSRVKASLPGLKSSKGKDSISDLIAQR